MDFKRIKNILIVVVVIVMLFFGYNWFVDRQQDGLLLISQEIEGEAKPQAARELLVVLKSLRKIKLDVSIFDDPAYLGLKDFSVVLTPQPQGRNNPFAPLE